MSLDYDNDLGQVEDDLERERRHADELDALRDDEGSGWRAADFECQCGHLTSQHAQRTGRCLASWGFGSCKCKRFTPETS